MKAPNAKTLEKWAEAIEAMGRHSTAEACVRNLRALAEYLREQEDEIEQYESGDGR
jgi:phosphosulfolactate phosphohydrolase-like enzyme